MYTSKFKSLVIIIFCFVSFHSNTAFANVEDTVVDVQDSVQLKYLRAISESASDKMKLLEAYIEYGEYLDQEDQISEAIEYLNLALAVAQDLKIDKRESTIANNLARIYWMNGNFDASTEAYHLALKAAERGFDSSEISKICGNMGNNYNYLGDYDNAIKYALKGIKIKETSGDLIRICYHYVSMANIFNENGNLDKREEYVLKAYKIKDVEGCASVGDRAKIYNSLGGIAEGRNELEKALRYYDTLMMISKEVDYNRGISAALTNSSLIYKQLDQPLKALELSIESEQYFGGNPYDVIFSNNNKAELYSILNQKAKALELANANINLTEIQYYSTEKLKCFGLLSELNYELLNFQQAYAWNDSLRITENHLRNQDVQETIEELETKYETEKKEQQIGLLTTENQLKNQRLNAGFALLGVMLIVILLILYILRIRKKQAELVQNNLQQQVFRSQMNPHFIFNVLGSIQNFMVQNDTRKASKYLSQFASLTRATLDNSSAETISLANEISMLEHYMELEKMRSPEKFDYKIHIDEELEVEFIQIPPMLIQPFVENSIKHGFNNITEKGILELFVTDKKDWIEFVIIDNGQGMQKKSNGHQSMAMSIFEKRRKLIQQKYKTDFTFELMNLKDENPAQSGVKIKIDIPVINNN
ncbi:MAG: histidine kinase [Bacteroidales bacterium]|nr:histidine kinase [Bacteroidales bacterium]